jgi:hypothetical protein
METYGVNRIWLKHFPTYYFFHDPPILDELNSQDITLMKLKAKSQCFYSDWLYRGGSRPSWLPEWAKGYDRIDKLAFVDSVTTGMRILRSRILNPSFDYVFYIAGVPLTWTDPSHFWKSFEHESQNKHGRDWYEPRFRRIFLNFKNLKEEGFKMTSVTPGSKLNSILGYQDIRTIYRR